MVVAILALALTQEAPVSLLHKPKAGESWAYRAKIALGGPPKVEGSGKLTFTATEVAADGSWTNTVEMGETTLTVDGREEDGGQLEMKLRRDAFGALLDWEAFEAREIPGFDTVELVLALAPPAPVRPGESWTGRAPKGTELKPLRFTLVGTETLAGKPLLRVVASGESPTVGRIAGSVWLSPDRFRLVRLELATPKDAKPELGAFSLKLAPVE